MNNSTVVVHDAPTYNRPTIEDQPTVGGTWLWLVIFVVSVIGLVASRMRS